MPLFPQGGGLYPDSIDNTLLADMAEATIKGRPVGSGLGNPQDLTGAQLAAILTAANGAAVYTNCRLDFVSSSLIRLSRYSGCLLTIDNVPQVIPAVGVDMGLSGWTAGICNYVYAYMNAGVMALIGGGAPVQDPRNGMWVASSNSAYTMVGMAATLTGPAFADDNSYRYTASFFNRRSKISTFSGSVNAGYTSYTGILAASNFICWAEENVRGSVQGTVQSSTALIGITTTIAVDGTPQGNAPTAWPNPAGYGGPVGLSGVFAVSQAAGHSFQTSGFVSSSTATWSLTQTFETRL